MKTQKLLVIVAIVCLLVGASGAAMARNDCGPDGTLTGGVYDEIVINEHVSCYVLGVVVLGDVRVRNADQFTMMGSIVNGNLGVTNTVSAALADNHVNEGNIVTRDNRFSTILRNVVSGGNIRVIGDGTDDAQEAAVVQNLIFVGNLGVHGNEKADVKENKVTEGDITCRNNDRLDSKDNDAFGGRVNCSRSLFDDR
jgi:hypothetical protein